MLRFSISPGVSILTILLLIDSVTLTKNNDIINEIDHSSPDYRYNRRYNQYRVQPKNSSYLLSNFTHVPQGLTNISLNDACVLTIIRPFQVNNNGNKSKDIIKFTEKWQRLSRRELKHTRIYSTKALVNYLINVTKYRYANGIADTRTVTVYEDTLIERKGRVNRPWKRRSLCAISDDIFRDAYEKEDLKEQRTLLDYDGPVPTNDVEDSDSLKTLVRVKRTEPESSQRDYLKDLANSFPRNSYESIDENSYDDDNVLLEAKREIKPQEFITNDDESIGSIDSRKIVANSPSLCRAESSSERLTGAPSVADKVNSLEKLKQETALSRGPLNDHVSIANRRSEDDNKEILNLPEDPIGLVRKKRDDLARVRTKNNLEEKAVNPSSLAIAGFKAKLLRLRRRAKKDRRDGSSKARKKKKRVGKKHKTGSDKSPKNVREKKNGEARTEGKSKVAIASVVSKKNNHDNFHRRSVKSKKSIEKIDSEHGRFPKRVVNWNKLGGNKIDALDSEFSAASSADGKTGAAEKTEGKRIENSISGQTKLRAKRDENTEAKHGFLNEEDELKYYENIREPRSDVAECVDEHGNTPLEGGDAAEGSRAVRSIEEVKELAEKLVTKVNELQSYLNIEEVKSTSGEKRIETRAIDDLCSNVSTGRADFKEPPKIVQKCVPSQSRDSAMKMVERKGNPVKRRSAERRYGETKRENPREKKRAAAKTPSTASRTVRQENEKPDRKWGRWTDWSSCSVTCGKGRQIRWRYCVHDCSSAETEMEEKACQLPACPPGKFLGIF